MKEDFTNAVSGEAYNNYKKVWEHKISAKGRFTVLLGKNVRKNYWTNDSISGKPLSRASLLTLRTLHLRPNDHSINCHSDKTRGACQLWFQLLRWWRRWTQSKSGSEIIYPRSRFRRKKSKLRISCRSKRSFSANIESKLKLPVPSS